MVSTLRIVHAVRSDSFAGVERYVSALAAGQARAGHQVSVIGGDPARMQAAWIGLPVDFDPAVTVADVVKALMRHRDTHILHAHMTAAELASALARPAVRAPIVVTRHFARKRGSSWPSKLLGRALGRIVTAQISISQFVADRIDGPSTVIHLGTDTRPDPIPPAERDQSVLVAQRFEAEKRTDLSLRVWAESGLGERGWVLRLAGDGALRHDLERLSHDLGIAASCEFLGYQQDPAGLMARSAVFLAPCPNEGFGLSVVEAMACATPVVAAREGAHAETVGASREAVLYGAEDIGSGGRALSALAEDAYGRATYGADLHRIQELKFSTNVMVGRTLDVYRTVVR